MKTKVTVWTKPAPIKANGQLVHPDPVLTSPQPMTEIEGKVTDDRTRRALKAQLVLQGHRVLTISVTTDDQFLVYIAEDGGARPKRSAKSRLGK